MPRKAPAAINEKNLMKGQLRKLNALRKSVGEEIGTKAFNEWLETQQHGGNGADQHAERIAAAIEPLVLDGDVSIPRGGYLLRRGRGRVIVERPE